MKTTLELYLSSKPRAGYLDYVLLSHVYRGIICSSFIKRYLGVSVAPAQIKITYSNKSPKEKGFKKFKIVFGNSTMFERAKIYVSGKFMWEEFLFAELLDLMDAQANQTYTYWVKIEEVK